MKFSESVVLIGIVILFVACFFPRESLAVLGVAVLVLGYLGIIFRSIFS